VVSSDVNVVTVVVIVVYVLAWISRHIHICSGNLK